MLEEKIKKIEEKLVNLKKEKDGFIHQTNLLMREVAVYEGRMEEVQLQLNELREENKLKEE